MKNRIFQYFGCDVVSRNAVIRYTLPAADSITLCVFDPFSHLIAVPYDRRSRHAEPVH